ncbi:hypothetical protein DRQ25_16155 [Candidatus Fermentibacteria bacterium]|nr:MAG: hypothetical protein DRQ25_16155 [Candidatus Fermentibacteria bacterium]
MDIIVTVTACHPEYCDGCNQYSDSHCGVFLGHLSWVAEEGTSGHLLRLPQCKAAEAACMRLKETTAIGTKVIDTVSAVMNAVRLDTQQEI